MKFGQFLPKKDTTKYQDVLETAEKTQQFSADKPASDCGRSSFHSRYVTQTSPRERGHLPPSTETGEKPSIVTRMVRYIKDVKSIISLSRKAKEGDYWKEVDLPDNKEELREIATNSALSQLPYGLYWKNVQRAEIMFMDSTENPDGVPTHQLKRHHHQPDSSIFHRLMYFSQEERKKREEPDEPPTPDPFKALDSELFKHLKISPSGMLFDPTTGLSAVMAKDLKTGKLTLAFGGTFSGGGVGVIKKDKTGSPFKSAKQQLAKAQIKADFHNFAIKSYPPIYEQATRLTAMIKDITENKEELKTLGLETSEKKFAIVGHSLGGGLVQYAAARNNVPGTAFNSAALGTGVLGRLSVEEKLAAKEGLVHNYLIDNDIINTPLGYKILHKLFTPTIIGKRTIISGQDETGKNSLHGRHSRAHIHFIFALIKKHSSLARKEE